MPHENYRQRLFSNTLEEDGDSPASSEERVHPLMDRQRGQSEGQRLGPRIGDTSDNNNCDAGNQRRDSGHCGEKISVEANSIVARALAALEDDCVSDVGTDRNGGGCSATKKMPRLRTPSTPQSASRVSSPPRKAQRRSIEKFGQLKSRFKNFGYLHSPANSSGASSQNSARYRRSLAKRGISQSNVRSPSRNAASSQNSPGRTVLGPRNAGRAVANSVVVRGTKLAVSQNENGEHPVKLQEMYSPFSEGKDEMAQCDDNKSRGDPRETAVSKQNSLIDLTGDDSGEDVSQPTQGSKTNEIVRDKIKIVASTKPPESPSKRIPPTIVQEETGQTENRPAVVHVDAATVQVTIPASTKPAEGEKMIDSDSQTAKSRVVNHSEKRTENGNKRKAAAALQKANGQTAIIEAIPKQKDMAKNAAEACGEKAIHTSTKSPEGAPSFLVRMVRGMRAGYDQTAKSSIGNHSSENSKENGKKTNAIIGLQGENGQTTNDKAIPTKGRDKEKPHLVPNPQGTTSSGPMNGKEHPSSMPPKENDGPIANLLKNDTNGALTSDNAGPKEGACTSKTKPKNTSARKTSPTRKAPAKKSSVGVPASCSLIGSLSCIEKDGDRAHIIRGLWEYENQAESAPHRFELRRNVSSDVESISLTTNGIFHGHFVYQYAPKGKPKFSLVIEESEVDLTFTEKDGELHVKGAGRNEFGRFDLDGTGEKAPKRNVYNVRLYKRYTERFPSRVPQPGLDENGEKSKKSNRKRKYSRVESSGSEVSGDMLCDENQSSREEGLPRAITMSAGESNISPGTDQVVDEVARNNKESETVAPASKWRRGKTFSDLVRAEPVSITRQGGEKYDLVPMSLPRSGDFHTSGAFNANDGSAIRKSWEESGVLQSMDHPVNGFTLTWNVRNVKRKYSQMNLDFFDAAGIVNVQDLLEADESHLCSRLMAFDKFKAACAFETWKSNVARRASNNSRQGKTFHDLYRTEFAIKSILTWKKAAESWYKKISHASSTQDVEVVSEMGEVSVENRADGRNATQVIDASSEMEEDNADDLILLERILSSREAAALKENCNIVTAKQLLAADAKYLIRRLTGFVEDSFRGRDQNEVECITEGMLYSWMLRAQEALPIDEPTTVTLSSAPPADEDENVGAIPTESRLAFKTRLSYFDLQFIRSQHISSDEQLTNSDCSLLAPKYVAHLGKMRKKISSTEAVEVINKWRHGARMALGLNSEEETICDSLPQTSRLPKDPGTQEMMNTVTNLCHTVVDEENEGLPRRTIFTYDRTNHVLYEFVASVKDSMCSAAAGKGAFLTYKGAKILKASSMRKKKDPRDIPSMSQTRKPLEAIFSTSGATVTLKGSNIHADERHYGPENDDSVGLYHEFTLDDFVDAEDNITFSSKHLGCALIELESRYAPLLPIDRKTDQLFSVKDFIFSHEPSSWRFDVPEELNGHPQVVDFTDDTTGAPHDVARAHMSMYVNEVGHNMDLIENVSACCPSPRAVTYYIHIDKPMAKNETVELLVNYKDHYEEMRERRGYGKANLIHGVRSDSHDITRVQRNLKDRFDVEASIMQFTEDEIRQVMDFFKRRVWDGVKAATSTLRMIGKEGKADLLRQCIARRRMYWLSKILQARFHELLGSHSLSLPTLDGDSEECIFQPGMFVFVNDWPKDDNRPPYTGIATITSISKNQWNRNLFLLELTDGKHIESVPEAVVTLPTHDDFKDAPKRCYSNWMKWKKQEDLPRARWKVLKEFDTLSWDPSFVWNIVSARLTDESSSELPSNIYQSLLWELSEELLFLLVKSKRLSHPFDEKIWCPLSVSLLIKCLNLVADFLLMGRDKKILRKAFLGLVRGATDTMKNIVYNSPNAPHASNLAFVDKSNKQSVVHVLIAEAVHINKLPVEDYLSKPQPLDLDWYLTHQIILAVHPLASLIDWDPSTDTGSPIYSIEAMCEDVGLEDSSYLNFYASKFEKWRPLLRE